MSAADSLAQSSTKRVMKRISTSRGWLIPRTILFHPIDHNRRIKEAMAHHCRRIESCSKRGWFTWLLTTPNDALPSTCPGKPNSTRLNRLKNSARNCIPARSLIAVVFTNARSQLLIPAERTSGSVRDTFPNVNGAGCLKTEVLNQPFRRLCAEPSSLALPPVEFGRTPPPREPVEFGVAVTW